MKAKYIFWALIFIGAVSFYYIRFHTMLLSSKHLYYGYYEEVNGLQVSDAISLNGVKVGYVKDIVITKDNRVKVVFAIYKDFKIEKGAVATISRGDFTGSKSIHMLKGKGPGYIPPNSILKTTVDSTLVDEYHAKVEPIIRHSMYLLRSADTGLANFNYIFTHGWGIKTQQEIQGFRRVTGNFATATGKANDALGNAQASVNKFYNATANPDEKNRSLNKSLSGLQKSTQGLTNLGLKENFNSIRANMNKLSGTIDRLNKEPLLTDPKPYHDINTSLDTLNKSMKEFQENPPGIPIFGSGK